MTQPVSSAGMRECDLIMKGGITSGVVYPFAIQELSKSYRFRSIGGSSAGAIAATMAAAAEYRRQTSAPNQADEGFQEVGELANELANNMRELFQPAPALKNLFDVLMAAIATNGGAKAVVKAAFNAYCNYLGVVTVVMLIFILFAVVAGSIWLGVLGVVLASLLAISLVARDLYKDVFQALPENDFGLCSGKTMAGHTHPGLTDWIADNIDRIAGNVTEDGRLDEPLTIGALEKAGVQLAAMTTDLSSQRPYQLPLRSKHHFFSRRDFEQLFPQRIVDYLCSEKIPEHSGLPDGPDDLYPLPTGENFPVVLCARMSLSFPGLISAVPLYRKDFGVPDHDGEPGAYRKCLFSDGGISSNFPMQFFDSLLPARPTFGITLTSYEKKRHGNEWVHLSDAPVQSTQLPVRRIEKLGAFLFSILNTAKDWQDTLQSKLPGFAERIVEIRLDETREGGLNLNMDAEAIQLLAQRGREAAHKLIEKFDFDENRWRRALSVLPTLEREFESINTAYANAPAGSGEDGQTYEAILTTYENKRYKNDAKWRADVLNPFAGKLSQMGKEAQEAENKKNLQTGNVPSQDASVRLLAHADRRSSD